MQRTALAGAALHYNGPAMPSNRPVLAAVVLVLLGGGSGDGSGALRTSRVNRLRRLVRRTRVPM